MLIGLILGDSNVDIQSGGSVRSLPTLTGTQSLPVTGIGVITAVIALTIIITNRL